jgi:hypothetical protein
MEKRFLIAGVKNIAGTSKKSGNNYSMFFATVLEPSAVGGVVKDAAGYEAREIEVEEQAMKQLAREVFPCEALAWLEINRDNKIRISSVKLQAKQPVGQPAAVKAAS